MFGRDSGLYGTFDSIPKIAQAGHHRRCELLDNLNIGDVSRMTIVDFGMGSWGFGSVYPKLHGCARAIGMDISNAAIEQSKKLVRDSNPSYADRFETYQSDGMALPLADQAVDLFFSGESIEHVRFPLQYLSEIYRVLKDRGQLIITTPNRDAIKYREKGEEYCTSPEHFWLFNYQELKDTLCVFFSIEEAYGFNGSYGSHEEDREQTDPNLAAEWSRQFKDAPADATGVVMRLTKKPGIDFHYQVEDISNDLVSIVGSDTFLPLEFGLKGLAMDQSDQSVTVRRPASDGVVCRFWCHRWSGITRVSSLLETSDVDLYAYVPGWRQWESRIPTTSEAEIVIRPTERRNAKALANQVIYFETFIWRRLRRGDRDIAGVSELPPGLAEEHSSFSYSIPKSGAGDLFLPGYGFERFKPFVGTTVFVWFSPTEGNVRGPWPPLGGRQNWTGKKEFWKSQIRQMMLANIDAIYLHCIDTFRGQRREFFKAYSELRSLGWDVPKVAPFLDPFGLWRESPIDITTLEGRDEFARPYIDFFEDYLAENTDPHAASYLLTIDGRLVITTWWVYSLVRNVEKFSSKEVTKRLAVRLQSRIPQLAHQIYTISTALIDPDLPFTDERMVMFSGYAYAIHSVHQSVDVWHVQAGYWDQNIRSPGYMLPRDGGQNYRRAWEAVLSAMPGVHRVYVESWNEYDEGSGIYASETSAPFVDKAWHTNSDRFSDTNDPYEYIRITAEGAARINGRLEYKANILSTEWSTHSAVQGMVLLTITVRNEGNSRWPLSGGFVASILTQNEGREVARVIVDDAEITDSGFASAIARGQTAKLNSWVKSSDARSTDLLVAVSHNGAIISNSFEVPCFGR